MDNGGTMKNIWQRGEVATGLWCVLGDPVAIEMAGRAGFDYVCVDLQHGFATWEGLPGILRALRLTPTCGIVRVPANDPALIMRALDLGATGIIVPLVEDSDSAARAVSACRYPTSRPGAVGGSRSFGPLWADLDGVQDAERTSDQVLCIVQIETDRGYQNVEEILSTPGIDAGYIGPNDLSLSSGFGAAAFPGSVQLDTRIQHIIDAGVRAGVVVGMHCSSAEMVVYWRERGARMLTTGTDTGVIKNAFGGLAQATRA